MRTPPSTPNNRYTHLKRLEECEVVAANALTTAREAHQRLDHQPPRGEQGLTGPPGPAGRDSVCSCKSGRDGAVGAQGVAGKDGRDGKDAAPCACAAADVQNRLTRMEQRIASVRDGATGPQGLSIKGDRGERGPAGADADNSAIEAMRKEVAEVKLMLQGLLDMNTKAGEYISFLKAKVAERLAAK
jgi:hypothetical protein